MERAEQAKEVGDVFKPAFSSLSRLLCSLAGLPFAIKYKAVSVVAPLAPTGCSSSMRVVGHLCCDLFVSGFLCAPCWPWLVQEGETVL